MISFAKRNLRVYFRDRVSVFFSLLGVLVILSLYLLFLGNTWSSSFQGVPGVRHMMDSWIMAGVLAVTTVTTSLGALGIVVEDRVKKIRKDFISSPVKRSTLTGGYLLSTIMIAFFMGMVSLVIAEGYIAINGGKLLEPLSILKLIGLIVFGSVMNSAINGFLVGLFKTNSSFATASTLVGTLIGFLTGIYLPIGELPGFVQTIIKIFPPSHLGMLMRQVMMDAPMKVTFAGAPAEMLEEFKESMGIVFKFGGTTVKALQSLLYMTVITIVFMSLAVWSLNRKAK